MPVKVPDHLPAIEILAREGIFVMPEGRAVHQDIRPLRILLLNLMPTKIVTEAQFLRLLSNSPLQLELCLMHPATYSSRNTPKEHLLSFYHTFADIEDEKFDGMIITGAPVEHLPFDEVAYWQELQQIMDWTVSHVTSTIFVCWGAQAALYHFYGIPKYPLSAKMFGIYQHTIAADQHQLPLFRGFDDVFYAPHSRHTEIRRSDLEQAADVTILSESETAGLFMASARRGRQIFVTGHAEYDALTLKGEYERDRARDLPITLPENYFPDDDPTNPPLVRWRAHANMLFSNWLNYYVYQNTPFDLAALNQDYPGIDPPNTLLVREDSP